MIPERLRLLRTENHKTQEELAKLLNITRVAYSYYEAGLRTPSIEVMKYLADYYSVSMEYLYGRTENRTFLPIADESEVILLDRFRSADNRGQDTILNIAWHEYIRYENLLKQKAKKQMEDNTKQPKNPFLNN